MSRAQFPSEQRKSRHVRTDGGVERGEAEELAGQAGTSDSVTIV